MSVGKCVPWLLKIIALRVAQGEVAEAASVAPKAILPAKFFPKMAAACHTYALFELWFWQAQRANPRRRLWKPALHAQRFASVALEAIRVEPRKGPRRRRRFCVARRHWRSIAHVRGGRKMLKGSYGYLGAELIGMDSVMSQRTWVVKRAARHPDWRASRPAESPGSS